MKIAAPIGNTQALTAFLLLLGAMFITACSLGFEHIGGYQPCQLCYIQRYVHYCMVPASAVTVLAIRMGLSDMLVRLMFLGLAALLAYGAGVGVYQAGAEWEFWLGPNCLPTVDITKDVGNLLGQLQSTKLVSCTVAQLRILGLSFGGWNVVLSSALIVIALTGALGPRDLLAPVFKRLPFLAPWMSALQKA